MSDYQMYIDSNRKRRASDCHEDDHRDKKRCGGRPRQDYAAAAAAAAAAVVVAGEPRGRRLFACSFGVSASSRARHPRHAGRVVKSQRSHFRDDSDKGRERSVSSSRVRRGSSVARHAPTGMAMDVDVPAFVSAFAAAPASLSAPFAFFPAAFLAAAPSVPFAAPSAAAPFATPAFSAAPPAPLSATADDVEMSDDDDASNDGHADVEMSEGEGDGDSDSDSDSDSDEEMPDSPPPPAAAPGRTLLGYNGFGLGLGRLSLEEGVWWDAMCLCVD